MHCVILHNSHSLVVVLSQDSDMDRDPPISDSCSRIMEAEVL